MLRARRCGCSGGRRVIKRSHLQSAPGRASRRLARVGPAIVLLAAGLGGCGGGGLSRPSIATPTAYQGGGKSNPTLSAQALDAWWKLYDDPQLSALEEEGLAANFDVRTSLQRISESRANRAQTLSALPASGRPSGPGAGAAHLRELRRRGRHDRPRHDHHRVDRHGDHGIDHHHRDFGDHRGPPAPRERS